MSGNNLFDQNSNSNDTEADKLQALTPEDAFATLVGEEAKFKTPEELAKAYAHLNMHAGKLESENGDLRESLTKAKTVEEVIAEMRANSTDTPQSTTPDNDGTPDSDTAIDISKTVEELVAKQLSERDNAQKVKGVVETLTQKFGDKAGELYKAKGAELGIDLDALAIQSPQAVLALFGEGGNQQPQSSFNSVNTGGNQNNVRSGGGTVDINTKAGLDKLHQEGKISREEKFRRQHEAIMKVGTDKFFGRA
jgi:hypothetical protein